MATITCYVRNGKDDRGIKKRQIFIKVDGCFHRTGFNTSSIHNFYRSVTAEINQTEKISLISYAKKVASDPNHKLKALDPRGLVYCGIRFVV